MQRLDTAQGPTHPAVNQIGVLWRSFFVISSLFSLLASLAAATPGKVQTLRQYKLLLFSQIPLRDCHFDLCMRPSTSRQTASSFGDTPILIQKRFSHLVAYTSTSAQYPNEYANLAFPFSRSFFLSSCEAVHPAEM